MNSDTYNASFCYVIGWMCGTRSGRLGQRWIWVKLRRGSRWWTNERRLWVTWLRTLRRL